jgi:hypothetical protein
MCCATTFIGLWCAYVEHRNNSQRRRWRSCRFIPMDRERWRTSVETWPRDHSHRVTSRGGWHLGHTRAREHGRANCITDAVEDWQDTCPRRGGRTRGALFTVVMVVEPRKPPSATGGGFCWVWAAKLSGGGSGGNRRWHMASSWRVRRGKTTSCGARVRQIKIPRVGPFRPWISG